MPRGARILLENVCYHILSRGNQKQKIFQEGGDYKRYLQLICRYKKRFGLKIYGYCLMPNHVHLIIEPRLAKEMSKAIGGINLCYTAWFNKKYNKVGHCWQDRFKSFIIEKNRYLISCINYVELNPVRANLVENPIDYLWSSYKTRLNGHEDKTLDKLELI